MHAKTFLRSLQRAPEPVKKRWLTGTSVTAVVLVLAGWIVYLNASIVSLGPEKTDKTVSSPHSFFSTLEKGFSVLGSSLGTEWGTIQREAKTLWDKLGAQLTNPATFSFVRETSPLAPPVIEPVPPSTLPVSQ